MTAGDNGYPLLALGPPTMTESKGRPFPPGKIVVPSPQRQNERLSPGFRALRAAFDNERFRLESSGGVETDPELVLVFDVAGTVANLSGAIAKVKGLEFLLELLDDGLDPNDDFFMEKDGVRSDEVLPRSINVVVSNAEAAEDLIRLWEQRGEVTWGKGKTRGLTPLRTLFEQPVDVQTEVAWDELDDGLEVGRA